jgi:hypothetical protein
VSDDKRGIGWKPLGAVLGVMLVAGTLSLIFLGTQVSGVLSTVGASVGSPGDYGAQEGDDSDDSDGGGGSEDGSDGSDDGDTTGESTGGSGGAGEVPILEVSRPDLLIVKTGEIRLQVGDIDAALESVTRAMTGLGAYASGTGRSGVGEEASAMATFRIPVAAWDEALIAARGLGTVLDEQSTTEDVTGTVVDLDARVRNLQATESALQAIMTKAGAIKDVLSVQGELTMVRGQIEEAQSRASHLRDQAALSTLTVHLGLTPAPVVTRQQAQFDPGSEVDAATATLVKLGQKGVKVGIWFAIVWLPVLVVLAILAGAAFLVVRRVRSREVAIS